MIQVAALIDQTASNDEGVIASGRRNGADANRQSSLVRKASKALLKQVEEARRKYAVEVDGLKAEIQLLNKEAQRDRRDADLAAVTAAAAKKAALDATEELERITAEIQRSKRALQQLNK
jgi:hypothetical protein